jgi:hypothetical protein
MRVPTSVTLAVVIAFAAGPVFPQASPEQSAPARAWWNGYIGWGPSFYDGFVGGNGAFGADFKIWRSLGIGGEVGMVGIGEEAAGVLSLNSTWSFVRSPFRTKGLVPYISGGISTASAGEGTGSTGGNFGVGVNWWFRERKGLQLELRDHCFGRDGNLVGLRIGLPSVKAPLRMAESSNPAAFTELTGVFTANQDARRSSSLFMSGGFVMCGRSPTDS